MSEFTDEELKNERWLPSAEEPGYEVSDLGRVRSMLKSGRPTKDGTRRPRDVPKILAFNLAGKPDRLYRIVAIGQFRKVYVHHLVCQTFNSPRPGKMGCAHHDGNKLNNRPGNLSWKTQVDNEQDKKRHGTWFARITNSSLSPEQIAEIRATDVSKRGSIAALAKKYGVYPPAISRVLSRQVWKHLP